MEESRAFIELLFEGYKKRKEENRLYTHYDGVPKIIIKEYLKLVDKPSFGKIINIYKRNYILCESRVEPNFTKEEQLGLAEVYDYIHRFDFDKDCFDIFLTSLMMHQKLYSHCGNGSFGGSLREANAVLNDVNMDIVSPEKAKETFNNYIGKGNTIFEKLDNKDIFGYIDECIKLNVELIKLQPFADGNKRVFRALLNLLLKKLNIPPVYITKKEQAEYKKALISAMRDNDFNDINQFYYYKICDAIVTLDIKNSHILDFEQACQKQKTLK